MFYFSYDRGEFFVIREFIDSYDVEIVDIVPFYDVKKIKDWCKCADMKFPYEFNGCVDKLLSQINEEYYSLDSIEYCLSSFHIYITNGDIKLYCEENRK